MPGSGAGEAAMEELLKKLDKLTDENIRRVSRYAEKLLMLQRLEKRLDGEIVREERLLQEKDPSFAEEKKGKGIRCSFCGKGQHLVDRLFAHDNVYICNECVELCVRILQEEG